MKLLIAGSFIFSMIFISQNSQACSERSWPKKMSIKTQFKAEAAEILSTLKTNEQMVGIRKSCHSCRITVSWPSRNKKIESWSIRGCGRVGIYKVSVRRPSKLTQTKKVSKSKSKRKSKKLLSQRQVKSATIWPPSYVTQFYVKNTLKQSMRKRK